MSGTLLFNETWPALPANVALARRAVVAHLVAAETTEPPLQDIVLSVSEAVSNAVNHAYAGDLPGPVSVRVDIGSDEIDITVEDEGHGMVPRPDSPGLGLGLPLMATVADGFDVRTRDGGGTQVCIWFLRHPPARV
jgi:serine/threonine-protein kinase RsbW/stage II sporulation protein AB (anti-sigma F factor)